MQAWQDSPQPSPLALHDCMPYLLEAVYRLLLGKQLCDLIEVHTVQCLLVNSKLTRIGCKCDSRHWLLHIVTPWLTELASIG